MNESELSDIKPIQLNDNMKSMTDTINKIINFVSSGNLDTDIHGGNFTDREFYVTIRGGDFTEEIDESEVEGGSF